MLSNSRFALLQCHSKVARETEPAAIGPPCGDRFRIGTAWLSRNRVAVPKSSRIGGCPEIASWLSLSCVAMAVPNLIEEVYAGHCEENEIGDFQRNCRYCVSKDG